MGSVTYADITHNGEIQMEDFQRLGVIAHWNNPYLTMNYFIIDTIDQTLEYSIGGHYPSPIIFDGKEAQFLPGGGFAVGIFDKASFKSEKMTLPPQYQLTLFSDGIMEILKGKDLTENEAKLLSVLSDGILAPHQLQSAFNIAATQSYPDDIALFTLVKH